MLAHTCCSIEVCSTNNEFSLISMSTRSFSSWIISSARASRCLWGRLVSLLLARFKSCSCFCRMLSFSATSCSALIAMFCISWVWSSVGGGLIQQKRQDDAVRDRTCRAAAASNSAMPKDKRRSAPVTRMHSVARTCVVCLQQR